MTEPHEILTRYKTFAVVGVSQNKEKYGYEVFETPGSWSDIAIKKCLDSRLEYISDVCIVFAVKTLSESRK